MQDAWTATLNAALLFVVLIYVYPLRFLTTGLTGRLFGVDVQLGAESVRDGIVLMLFYSTGVLLIFITFVLLHRHAWRQRAALKLTKVELLNLRYHMRSHLISAGLAALSIVFVALAGLLRIDGLMALGGWIYVLMGPAHAWNGTLQGKAMKALDATATEKA